LAEREQKIAAKATALLGAERYLHIKTLVDGQGAPVGLAAMLQG